MGKIHIEFETEYEKGDIVIFKKNKQLVVGLIEGYYIDNHEIWYNIRTNYEFVYTYSNGGDIAESDILMKLNDVEESVKRHLTSDIGG